MKNSEPTKNVMPSAFTPTRSRYAGTAPSAKQAEPTMNSTATHHTARSGAHQRTPVVLTGG